MSLFTRKAFLTALTPIVQPKRCRGKINIQRPRAPHFERAKYLALAKPFYPKKLEKPCDKNVDNWKQFKEVDNPYQRLLAQELLQKIESSRLVGFLHMNSMTGEQHFKAEVLFYRQQMEYKNYGKATLTMAVKGTPYEVLANWYSSHNMMVFSPELKIKELLKVTKRFPSLVLLAAIVDNRFINVDKLQKLSLIPNLEAARQEFVSTLDSVGRKVISQLNSHQNTVVAQLHERAKQLEEKGEE